MARRRGPNKHVQYRADRTEVRTLRTIAGTEFDEEARELPQLRSIISKCVSECVEMDIISERQSEHLVRNYGLTNALRMAKKVRRELSDPFRFVVGEIKPSNTNVFFSGTQIPVTRLHPDSATSSTLTEYGDIIQNITNLKGTISPGLVIARHASYEDAVAHSEQLSEELATIDGIVAINFTEAMSIRDAQVYRTTQSFQR